MAPDAGEVWFDGQRIDGKPPWRRAHLGLGRTFQITRLFREMTVLENVVAPLREFRLRPARAPARSAATRRSAPRSCSTSSAWREFRDERAGALSYGQQKLVELAQVLMLDPKLILLDEPAGGINPTLIDRIGEMIRELNAAGKTFLIVEHNMPFVLGLCDPVLVLAAGRRSRAAARRGPARPGGARRLPRRGLPSRAAGGRAEMLKLTERVRGLRRRRRPAGRRPRGAERLDQLHRRPERRRQVHRPARGQRPAPAAPGRRAARGQALVRPASRARSSRWASSQVPQSHALFPR